VTCTKSALLALAAALLAATASGQEAKPDERFVLRVKRTPAVGDRWFLELDESQETKVTVAAEGKPDRHEEHTGSMQARLVHEVVELDGKQVSKERVTIERWAAREGSGEPDRCLEGKTVVVTGTGAARKPAVEGDASISERGRAWLEKELGGRARWDRSELCLADEAVVGAEWDVDVKALAASLVPRGDVDVEGSRAKATLVAVRVEEGVRVAHVDVDVAIKTHKFPGTELAWTEGGVLKAKLGIDESLDPARRRGGGTLALELVGKAQGQGLRVESSTIAKSTRKRDSLPRK
jgi:hypothetical protein